MLIAIIATSLLVIMIQSELVEFEWFADVSLQLLDSLVSWSLI
jgi:hypothetical protein